MRKRASERRAIERLSARATSDGASADPLDALADAVLWTEVRSLPGEQAAAIALRYVADLSITEVADTLEISPTAAKSLLHRGRRTLRTAPSLETYAE